jgi:hypothetical protein
MLLIFSFVLVSIHTSPLSHAGSIEKAFAQQQDCSDHVHQTADRHDVPQPKALLPNAMVIFYIVAKRVSSEAVTWRSATKPFAPFAAEVVVSRAMRPPIPPPTG